MRNCCYTVPPVKQMKTKSVRISQETYDAFREIAEANSISVNDAIAMTARLCKHAMSHLSPFAPTPTQQETTVRISNVPSPPQTPQQPVQAQASTNTNEPSKAANALERLKMKAKGGAT